jgi:predicted Zn-dependent peptidase
VHTSRFGVPATINFEFILDDARQIARAEKLIGDTLQSLGTAPPSGDEVERARRALRVAWYRTMRDTSALAFDIGHFQTMDSWRTLPEFLKAREATTGDDIRNLARRYFIADNLSVGIARPKDVPTQARALRDPVRTLVAGGRDLSATAREVLP